MTRSFENGAAVSYGEAQCKQIRQVQVIFLRHGEREDETADYDKHQKTRQERIDPALTVLGHQQALGAWRKILTYVPKDKPIMVACSPLRRCIGTAMMIAAATSNISAETGLKIVLPTDNVDQEQTEGVMDTTTDEETAETSAVTIPMLVMNGLGDCAAQMQHMGGIGKVVKAGWLTCAASPGNDCLDPNAITPLQNSLRSIASNATNLQTRWGSNNATESCHLQFWRESRYHYYESSPRLDFAIMTEPRTLQEHAAASGHAASNNGNDPLPMPKNAPSCDERFDQAVERAVLQTAHAGLDTCVLVTHREAIRWIETHWVRPRQQPPRTPEELEQYKKNKKHRRDPKLQATRTYCCVGDYEVTVDLTNSEKPRILSWESKKIVPWAELEKDQH